MAIVCLIRQKFSDIWEMPDQLSRLLEKSLMLQDVQGFFIHAFTYGRGGFAISYNYPGSGPLPPGTNVYASIALSHYNSYFLESPPPNGVASAMITSWTEYLSDGTESSPVLATNGQQQNAVFIENCASINFTLFVLSRDATAQINIFNSNS